MVRIFVESEAFASGQLIEIQGKELHHARDVLRAQVGEKITVVNGRGWIGTARIDLVERKRIVCTILDGEQRISDRSKLWLVLGNMRPHHLDFAVEKGVEIGVDAFLIFQADRSEVKLSDRSTRIEAVIRAAVKQSARLMEPVFSFASNLDAALKKVPHTVFWANFGGLWIRERLAEMKTREDTAIFIGPESGWSEREVEVLSRMGPSVLLDENVLRAETAAIVAAYEVARWLRH